MQKKNTMKLNKTAICCIFIYCVITLIRLFNHIPWFDEAHAYTIAEQLNFLDMFNYVKNEGHFFLWQALLYPFAKLHWYPLPMQILNWSFCTVALILMWWKAPFNNIIKALITFSFPFLCCYSVIARCYSIGIMFLFLLAILYDEKIKYPKVYSFLLILCANTSVMGLIGATAFGILFLVDVFKNKLSLKNTIFSGLILCIGAFLILYQILNIEYANTIVENGHFYTTLIMFQNVFVYHRLLINLLLLFIVAIPILKYLFKVKSGLFFLLFTYFCMLILSFKFYGINFWHAYFFYIYLLVAFWLVDKKVEMSNFKTFILCVFGVISFVLIFHGPEEENFSGVFNSETNKIINYIENDEILNSAVIIHNTGSLYEILPYWSDKSYKLKNYCSVEDNTDYNLNNILYGECVRGNIFGQAQKSPDIVKSIVDKYGEVYSYTEKNKNPQISNYAMIFTQNYGILIKKYKCFDEKYCFWKVEIKK